MASNNQQLSRDKLNASIQSNDDLLDYAKKRWNSDSFTKEHISTGDYLNWLDDFSKKVKNASKPSLLTKGRDESKIIELCEQIQRVDSLKTYLNDFGIVEKTTETRNTPLDYFRQEPAYITRILQYWINEQEELISRHLEEGDMERQLGSSYNKKEIVEKLNQLTEKEKPFIQLQIAKAEAIVALDKHCKPNDITSTVLIGELIKKIENAPSEDEQKRYELIMQKLAVDYTGVISLDNRVERIKEINTERKILDKDLLERKKQFTKGKEEVDKHLVNERDKISRRMNDPVTDYNRYIYELAEVRHDLYVYDEFEKCRNLDYKNQYFSSPELYKQLQLDYDEIIHTKKFDREQWEAKQHDLEVRKDDTAMSLLALQNQLNAYQIAYTQLIKNEEKFQEQARKQLELLKTLPAMPKAFNAYCTTFRYSFGLFLYIGELIAGDGKAEPTFSGGGISVLKKLPFAVGMLDLKKCRAYDTGSMEISLKLGLGLGIAVGVAEAGIGLALEINGGIAVSDYRDFVTSYGVAIKAVADVKIPELFSASLEIEIATFSMGAVYQDQYHWAACLAHFWGRMIAKKAAIDIYMDINGVDPEQKPKPEDLSEIEKLADEFFKTNTEMKELSAAVAQYLAYPLLRTRQMELSIKGLKGVSLEVSGPSEKLGAGIGRVKGDVELFRLEKREGKEVEYVTEYKTNQRSGFVSLVSIDWFNTENDPRVLNNGKVLNLTITTWKTGQIAVFLDELLSNLTSKDTGKEKATREFFSLIEQAVQFAASKATSYVSENTPLQIEKSKSVVVSLAKVGDPEQWALMYVRTAVDINYSVNHKIPVGHTGIYIELGASFDYSRSSGEVMGWHSIYYPLYLYVGLMHRCKMQQEQTGKAAYALRPEKLTGEALWKQYVNDHKSELWHLFMSIGKGETLVIKDLRSYKGDTARNKLINACMEHASNEKFKITPFSNALLAILGGVGTKLLPISLIGGTTTTIAKHSLKIDTENEQTEIEDHFQAILPFFNAWLEAVNQDLMQQEKDNKHFKPVVKQKKVFRVEDNNLIKFKTWALQLHEATQKDRKVCENCLRGVGNNYEQALYLLSAAQAPKQYWIPDNAAKVCQIAYCGSTLSMGNRHHCRICGGIFCSTHCTDTTVPYWIADNKIKVCQTCATRLNDRVQLGAFHYQVASRLPPSISSNASKLWHDTGKDIKVCVSCLNATNNNYEQARLLLADIKTPEKYWALDKDVKACVLCNTLLPSNKHHCRVCGGIFCGNCCPQKTFVSGKDNHTEEMRVCKTCSDKAFEKLSSKTTIKTKFKDDLWLPMKNAIDKLVEQTHKRPAVCEKCLNDVNRDLEKARTALAVIVVPKKYWVDDSKVTLCTVCSKPFQGGVMTSGKHHCRICGGVVCQKCSGEKELPAWAGGTKQRICTPCEQLTMSGALKAVLSLPETEQIKQSKEVPKTSEKSKPVPITQDVQPSKTKTSLLSKGHSKSTGSLMGVGKQTSSTEQVPKKLAADAWYRDGHIDWLLHHYINGNVGICAPILDRPDQQVTNVETLHACIEEALSENKQKVVIPISLGDGNYDIDSTEAAGNHWIGVYLHFTNAHSCTVFCVDPLNHYDLPSSNINRSLNAAFNALHIVPTNGQAQTVTYQTDGYNCGPWVIAILDWLVKNESFPSAGVINITERRRQNNALFRN